MALNNKRPAEDEIQSSRTRKRQAAASSTRITRSMRKIIEDNGIPVQLHLGLPTVLRQRKKLTPSTPAQRECTSVQAPEQAAVLVEPVAQPVAICSSAPGNPGKHLAEAANPGGPAPVADMGSNMPVTITSCHTDVPPQESDMWSLSINARLRAPSNSSQSSPLSQPAQVCSVATASPAQTAHPELDPEFHGIEDTQEDPADMMLAWSMVKPAWTEVCSAVCTPADENATGLVNSIKGAGSDGCKANQTESKPAVLNAAYTVSSIQEAGELLANEMDARKVDDNQELPIVEIFLHDLASQDSEHLSPRCMELSPVSVECGANSPSTDNPECTMPGESTDVRELQCNAAMGEEAAPTENIKTCCAPTPLEAFYRSNAPSLSTTRGSISAGVDEQSLHHAKPLCEPSKTASASHTAANMPGLPESPKKTAQQIANLKREKELKAKLIEMKRARMMVKQPCVQNVLVRTSDGSLSIITAKAAHVTNWDLEDDQYSVEEYEEDTVSY